MSKNTAWVDCPPCRGTGDDLAGCGCQCESDEEAANCPYPQGCANCGCQGCGGSCPYCGGSGNKNDWQEGNPPYETE